jgi:signal peptide peptidase SppA
MNPENLNILTAFNQRPAALLASASVELMMTMQRFVKADHGQEVKSLPQRMGMLAATYGGSVVERKPYVMVEGVAVIPVHGVLINSFGDSYGYVTGYNYIRRMIDIAESDDDVVGIAFDCASPGGMVQGCFETADLVATISKPTAAFVDSMAASACYAIAAACDKIYATESAILGSVGVLRTHMDYSKYMEDLGINVTLHYRGDHKVDGNPYEPLSDGAKANWDAELDKTYSRFTEFVAENRKMDKKAVVETQAAVYSGQESVRIGFSDAVVSIKDGFSDFLSGLNNPNSLGSKAMSDQNANADTAGAGAAAAQPTTPVVDAAATAQAAVTAERERISAIMGCDEAKERNTLATHLALNTSMSVADAKATLAVAASEKAQPSTPAAPAANNAFAAAMASGNPEIGADATEASNSNEGESVAQRILNAQQLIHGSK